MDEQVKYFCGCGQSPAGYPGREDSKNPLKWRE